MNTLGEKIRDARKLKNLKQNDLGKVLNVGATTISNWEKGVSRPDVDMIEGLCGALDVKPEYFFDSNSGRIIPTLAELDGIKKYRALDAHGKDMVDTVLEKEYRRSITKYEVEAAEENIINFDLFIQPSSAGTGIFIDDDKAEKLSLREKPEYLGADFALTVSGNSMEPLIYDGDYLLIKNQPTVNHGELGIFILNGQAYVKRFYKKDGLCKLISLNVDYDDIVIKECDTIECYGKVVARVNKDDISGIEP